MKGHFMFIVETVMTHFSKFVGLRTKPTIMLAPDGYAKQVSLPTFSFLLCINILTPLLH